MIAELIDAIYEAAFIPEKWPAILAGIAEAAASKSGGLVLFADGQPVRGTTIPSLQDLMDEFVSDETLRLSASTSCMSTVQPASFIDVDSFKKSEEIRDDPIRIQLRARGLGASARAIIPMPGGEIIHFVFQRGLEDGGYQPEHFALLDRLRPDMARAGLAATRLGLEHAHGTVNALATMGLPAAVLAANGRVKVSNTLFDQENALFVPTAFGRVALANPDGNRLLQLALQNSSGTHVRSIPLQNAAAPAMVVHVLPLKRDAHDLFSGGDLLIVATTISASNLVPSPTILTGLFDFTQAEVSLATALAKGLSLKAAAAEAGLQVSTVRTYLNRIFRKTGTNQQSQLVALLKSAHPFQGLNP
ncbi:helix-turn-helix transcriptional regulator [Aestuariivirga sp. YIM B02566]|uniref:Helix-turn-helix transcriptional regulator n=1 Tax=Taklimakanibacter albus TaxID=2800327 RepID=A0ACC5R7L9_9HYPH|nr:helix-turn-helix transcriptional regulator [Aestuariivirga sp. YIM B02566]MBK1868618.1 helix-turn-helix transcriptional regulator [Aestuariivirga sp. YIM B02566]